MMEEVGEGPFVTTHTSGVDEPAFITGEATYKHEMEPPAAPYESEQRGDDVVGLIPLCVRHAEGPQINTAVFGYDIAQMQKRPWDDPAANLRDYFNYGFNESSWRLYCAMQAEGESSILAKANTFLRKLNAAAAKSGVEEGMGGEPAPYYIPPPHAQGSSHSYYTGQRDGYHGARGVCQRFLEGRCNKGEHCNYSHVYGGFCVPPAMQQHHHRQQQYVLPNFGANPGVLPQVGAPMAPVLDPNTPMVPYGTAVAPLPQPEDA